MHLIVHRLIHLAEAGIISLGFLFSVFLCHETEHEHIFTFKNLSINKSVNWLFIPALNQLSLWHIINLVKEI